MKIASHRLIACWTLGCLALALHGCASRPDVVGHNSEAQDWAEQQRREEAQNRNQLDRDRWPRDAESSADRPQAQNAPRPEPAPPAQPVPGPAPQPNE